MTLAETYSVNLGDPADIVTAAATEPGELLAQWIDRPAWMDRAACRGEALEVFFPARGTNTVAQARAVCESCPVYAACLRYALDDPELQGVWGATTTAERRAIRRAAA